MEVDRCVTVVVVFIVIIFREVKFKKFFQSDYINWLKYNSII